ncbi:MAG: tRNA (adenosine(37)-N6)-threonylcarbamoyltransferase complex dimerization subunit type 1 TsaB [Sphingomonadaceae bacterium]
MLTLAIETAGAACSLALFDGTDLIAERHEVVGRGHAERLIPWIADFPDGGRADRIIIGCGPGSFTGVRIGVAAARALGLGWGIPVIGVSSLALIAARCDEASFSVAVEGGHGEVFIQNFSRSPLITTNAVVSLAPEQAGVLAHDIIVGNGAARVVAARGSGHARDGHARAAIARFLPNTQYLDAPRPIYGRAADAKPAYA